MKTTNIEDNLIGDSTHIVEINRTLKERYNLKIDLALGDWEDTHGITVPFFKFFFWKFDEKTGERELWSSERIHKMLDEMESGNNANEESKKIAEEIIELIGEFLCSIESLVGY